MHTIRLIERRFIVHPTRNNDEGHFVTAIAQQEQQVLAVSGTRHVQIEQYK